MNILLSLIFSFSLFANSTLNSSEIKALEPEAKRLWNLRHEEDSLNQALLKYELIQSSDPQHREALLVLTRGHYLMGEYFTEDTDIKKKHFEKSRDYSFKGLQLNPAFKKKMEQSSDIEKSLTTLTPSDVDFLYWNAASLGKWAKVNGIFSSLKYKSQIIEMIKRVESLNADYFFAAVPRYWGGFFALAPSIAGGDMKKSLENFELSMKKAPQYLGTKVLYAEVYLTKKDDKKAFIQVLGEVVNSQVPLNEIYPENNLEKKKAGQLLKRVEDFF